MCDNSKAILEMKADIKQIMRDMSKVEQHLDKQNGRISKQEYNSHCLEKAVAVLTSKVNMEHEYGSKAHKRFEEADRTLLKFVKDNGLKIAEIAALLAVVIKTFDIL